MSQSVVPNADKPEGSSAVVRIVPGIATVNSRGKCMTLSALLAAKTRRYLLSLEKGDLCTAAIVTLKLEARLTFRKNSIKREGDTGNITLSPLSISLNRLRYTFRRDGTIRMAYLNRIDLSNLCV